MIEATIDQKIFSFTRDGQGLSMNGQLLNTDAQPVGAHLWQVLHHDKSYDVFVHKVDLEAKTMTLSINGKVAQVHLRTRMEKLLAELGMSQNSDKKLDVLKAPMPGLILQVLVEVGQSVEKGQPLLILEAMKMENILKSPGPGVIHEIVAQKGSSTEKNAILIRFV